ncbi:hypothetical protein WA026_004563 [Henosepilachna vigintioctopunctata]|uniref:Uncharacterized protein n=1 Tax=Henosepilachna vigintioctopunctata TaxID=420089 RepID=A0AAW1V7Z9_9CUCU
MRRIGDDTLDLTKSKKCRNESVKRFVCIHSDGWTLPIDPGREPFISTSDICFLGKINISETNMPVGLIQITVVIREPHSADVMVEICFIPFLAIVLGTLLCTIDNPVSSTLKMWVAVH